MLLIPIFDINPGLIKNYGFEEWQIDSKAFNTYQCPYKIRVNNRYLIIKHPSLILDKLLNYLRFIIKGIKC